MKEETRNPESEYLQVFSQLEFSTDLDYSQFEARIPFLDQLATVSNSGITVFDLYRREHIYTSFNLEGIFGLEKDEIVRNGNDYFNSKVHPDDLQALIINGIDILRFYIALSPDERDCYKLINEYRMINGENKYIRVIEQHLPFLNDRNGTIWLALGVIDISPDQQEFQGIKSKIINHKTGEIVQTSPHRQSQVNLTNREKEIFNLIRLGLLSKEISDRLSISVHTVNTHRQRILEKYNAGNSLEAIQFASKLGLLD